MRRVGNLIEKIADKDNIELAFWKAQRCKSYKKDICCFRRTLAEKIDGLRKQILSANVVVGNYKTFKIFDPKERLICSADFSERVLHHAIMNICLPYFERHFIDDTYACRKNKGTYKALAKAKKNQLKYSYFLKIDVRKYFDSINHLVLKEKLERLFKDKLLLNILFQIIDSYHVGEETYSGLPIGNLTSQFFANYYLSFADHYVKEELKIPAYVRYMDDIVMWSNEKEELRVKGEELRLYLHNYFKLNLKQFYIQSTKHGLPFLGFLLRKRSTSLMQCKRQKIIRRINGCFYNYRINKWDQECLARHLRPVFSMMSYADTYGLRCKILQERDVTIGLEPCQTWW